MRELPLAHVNRDRVEAAYRRSDLFERRRELMEQWAAFLAGTENGTAELDGTTAVEPYGQSRSVWVPTLGAMMSHGGTPPSRAG